MRLDYQGIACLKDDLTEIYDRVRPYLNRSEDTKVVVGGIRRFSVKDQDIIIQSDFHSNIDIGKLIDRQYGESQELIDSIMGQANIHPDGEALDYSPSLDLVLVSPMYALRYRSVKHAVVPPPPFLLGEHARFFSDFVKYLVKWDFGNTIYNKTLRDYFCSANPSYDNMKHDRFSLKVMDVENEQAREKHLALGKLITNSDIPELENDISEEIAWGICAKIAGDKYTLPFQPRTLIMRAIKQLNAEFETIMSKTPYL